MDGKGSNMVAFAAKPIVFGGRGKTEYEVKEMSCESGMSELLPWPIEGTERP